MRSSRRAPFPSSYRLDVVLDELEPIADGARVHVHHGTSHSFARVVRAGDRYAQLRLAAPVVAARGDRVVLRAHTTVGGGVVLDPAPPRHVDPARLELLERGDPAAIVRATVHAPVTGAELQARGLLAPRELARGLAAVRAAGDWYFTTSGSTSCDAVHERLRERAAREPLDPGLPLGQLLLNRPWANAVAPLLELERRGGKAYLPGTAPSLGAREEDARRLEAELARGRLRQGRRPRARALPGARGPPRTASATASRSRRRCTSTASRRFARSTPITLAGFRDALDISRRVAQLLLERYDADGLTRRVGDERVLRRAARE